MKTYKNKTVKAHDKTFCDCCGKQCTDDFYNDHENATLEAVWGYNSRSDGKKFELELCEDCFYETIRFLKEKRFSHFQADFNEEWGLGKNDPFDGCSYNTGCDS